MAYKNKIVILAGAPQNLETGGPTITPEQSARSIPLKFVKFQVNIAENPEFQGGSGLEYNVYFGHDNTVSPVNYGASLRAIPAVFNTLEFDTEFSSLKLADFWVYGDAGEPLTIAMIPY